MSPVSDDEGRKALGILLNSRAFARAEQLRQLLQYVVEATIEGRAGTLKESTIGVDVFGLPPDFDPKVDPVVRMGMRRLRDRLQKYYLYEGAADPVLISLEPGSYVPRFLAGRNEPGDKLSIAVLPFATLQEDASEKNTGILLREALLARLAENKRFRLIGNEAPESIWADSDLGSIGRRLKVRLLVRGACFVNSETIRVCTEFFCPFTNEPVWSGNHEQAACEEMWTIQNDIAAELERYVPAADERGQAQTGEPLAQSGVYRLSLQGRHYLLQNNPESIRKAERCFAKVLEKEPNSAKVWAALSVTHTLMALYHMAPPKTAWQKAESAARRAIALEPLASDSHIAMGLFIVFNRFEPARAEQHFRIALEANSGDNVAPIVHAMTCLAPLGKLQEAEDEIEGLLARDPLNPKALQMMAVILYFQRRYETAVEVGQSALDILPGSAAASLILAASYERLGRQEDALKYYRKCEHLMPFMRSLRWSLVVTATYKGRSKWVRPTLLAIAKLLQSSSRTPSAMLADLLLRIGEREVAVPWIERAFHQRAVRALYLAVDPAFDSVRSDPRCLRLIEKLTRSAGNNNQRSSPRHTTASA